MIIEKRGGKSGIFPFTGKLQRKDEISKVSLLGILGQSGFPILLTGITGLLLMAQNRIIYVK